MVEISQTLIEINENGLWPFYSLFLKKKIRTILNISCCNSCFTSLSLYKDPSVPKEAPLHQLSLAAHVIFIMSSVVVTACHVTELQLKLPTGKFCWGGEVDLLFKWAWPCVSAFPHLRFCSFVWHTCCWNFSRCIIWKLFLVWINTQCVMRSHCWFPLHTSPFNKSLIEQNINQQILGWIKNVKKNFFLDYINKIRSFCRDSSLLPTSLP